MRETAQQVMGNCVTDPSINPNDAALADPGTWREHIAHFQQQSTKRKMNVEPHPVSLAEYLDAQTPIKISGTKYAFGILIFRTKEGHAQIDGIYQDGFLQLVNHLGFYKRYCPGNTFQYILEKEGIIRAVEISQIRDAVNGVMNGAKEISFDHEGLRFYATAEIQKETLLRHSHILLSNNFLGHLPNHQKPILKDTQHIMFFPFKDCLIKVTKQGVYPVSYIELDTHCIWQDHIIPRPFKLSHEYDGCQYAHFIKNVASGQEDRIHAFKSAIGYLLHNHSNPTTARAVIAYDEQIARKHEPQGGSGKGVFSQALGQMRAVAILDGKKIRQESQFSYQQVTERTQVISFDDVRPDFDFLLLSSNLTTGWQIEHKHKPAFRFAQSDNPKTYITSNTILKAEGTTAERRQFVIEFSPFYRSLLLKKLDPIIHHHGGMFFTDNWDEMEWNRFYSYMLYCAQFFLQHGLVFYQPRSVAANKLLQQTSDDFAEWCSAKSFSLEQEYDIKELLGEFKDIYYEPEDDLKQRTFTNYLKIYCQTQGWTINYRRTNGKTIVWFTNNQCTSAQDSIA